MTAHFPLLSNKHRGESILEMMMTVFIIVLVMTIMTSTFISMYNTYSIYSTRGQLLRNTSDMLQSVATYANESFTIATTHTIGGTTYTSDATTVIFQIASIDATGMAMTATYDYIIITIDPTSTTRLLEITDADAASSRKDRTRTFGDGVQQYRFAYRNADPATSNDVYFMVSEKKQTNHTSVSYTNQIYAKLRNN